MVVDDFYSDVDDVRQLALQQPFDVKGNYPGHRTKSFLNDSIKELIQRLIFPQKSLVFFNVLPPFSSISFVLFS